MKTDDLLYNYAMPQENGNKTDVRWVALTDRQGTGLIAVGLVAVVASAVPFLSDKLSSDDEVSVMTHRISRGDVTVTVTENGMLESSNNEEIKCMVKGGSTVLWVIETGTMVKPGDVLVPFRKILSEKDVLLLKAYQKHKFADIYRDVPWTFFTILFMVAFYNLFLSKIIADGPRIKPPYRFLLTLLITTVLVLNGYLALLPFPIYGLPICILPMIVIFLNHGKIIATATTMIGAMLVSLFTGPTYEILLFFTFGGLVAVLISSGLQKRLQILVPSLMVGFVNALSIIVFTMDWQAISSQIVSPQTIKIENLVPIVDAALTLDIAWAAIGGLWMRWPNQRSGLSIGSASTGSAPTGI